ncbi:MULTISPECIES: beta-N-acetylhexosaminidase [unclassified Proteiniphilum]|jgi:hexosaminidase|uniref:beta-N-acetylhexosaminidase n=1 Tax=Proteiniphilum sp. UBA5310 TaxID=1947275 RepID=UPI00257E24C8|nr:MULTISPECIES: beta-N-acetylhexosaminidase [unclassified Proteiniphilum]
MMKQVKLLTQLFLFTLLLTGNSCAEKERVTVNYEIIPLPQNITIVDEEPFVISRSTYIGYPEGNDKIKASAEFLSSYINETVGIKLAVKVAAEGDNIILLKGELEDENPEAYKITVSDKGILMEGASESGLFYAVQTIRKSVSPLYKNKEIAFPAGVVYDFPRFGYRAALFDVGRYFYSTDFIKRFIDILALHNINYFHWHLTEDQGWRIEIKKYPLLTEIGSMRKETLVGHLRDDVPHQFDGTPHGGFYTQDEIRDIVKYAQERYITVIPEVDLPGHMLAALAAYPNLGCTGGSYEVATKWGVFEDVLCMGKESTYQFLEDVFSEVVDLFPSEYIHIGGDECPKVRWEECNDCQNMIAELGLKSDGNRTAEQKLQSYAMARVEKFLKEKGRRVIAWEEILDGGIAEDPIVMSWLKEESGAEAAKKGYDVIMTPHKEVYIDYYQWEDKENEPLAIGGFVPLERVYNFEPVPAELDDEQKKHIIGTQVNLWTEYVSDPKHAEYMLLPRLAAISEVQWSDASKKDYDPFVLRLKSLYDFYDLYNYNAARHIFND